MSAGAVVAALVIQARARGVVLTVENGGLAVEAPETLSAEDLDLFRQYKLELLAFLSRTYLDFETASQLDLRLAGPSAYAAHPSTRVLLLGYAISDGPYRCWRPGEPLPEDLRQALALDGAPVAHNIGFETAIWAAHQEPLGWPPLPWARWSDTSARARLVRLPARLEGAAAVLELPVQKDNKEGKALMLRLARTAYRGGPGESVAPADFSRLAEYNAPDVLALRELDRRVPELSTESSAVAQMSHEMNLRGMPVDMAAVHKLIEVRDREDARLMAELVALTGGALYSLNQTEGIKKFVASHGLELADMSKDTLERWDDDAPERNDVAAKIIRLRREFAHSAGKKLDAMVAAAGISGRVRDSFVFHGAHTGRWSGRGVQPQNLPRNTLQDSEATLLRLTSENGVPADCPDARLSIKKQIAGVLRALFLARLGYVLVAGDLSQIEARILCWVAGQLDKLELFRRGEDVYRPTAERLGSSDRNLGKLLVLGAGYGAGPNVLLQKAKPYGLTLTESQAQAYVNIWRRDNAAIERFWYDLHDAVCRVVESPLGTDPVEISCLSIWRSPEATHITLPSGRDLIYRNARMRMKEGGWHQELVADLPKGGAMLATKLWHGLLTENVCSGIARDLITEAMLELHRDGIPLIATIHDEVVAECRAEEAEQVRQRLLQALSQVPAWAPGLPLAAEAFVNRRFIKPKEKKNAKPGNQPGPDQSGADQAAAADPQPDERHHAGRTAARNGAGAPVRHDAQDRPHAGAARLKRGRTSRPRA